tara:strand:+ start:767 stop:1750 length:984 start_codon:yes stop_codon:yes gene_type:complete
MPWVDPLEFFAAAASRGPNEVSDAGSEFLAYDGADLDVKFLIALQRQSHPVVAQICIPDVYMCIQGTGKGTEHSVTFRDRQCAGKAEDRIGAVRAGLMLYGKKLWLPLEFTRIVDRCRKRFLVFNFGVHSESDITRGHANAFLLDKRTKTAVRFDPSGSTYGAAVVAETLKRFLPDWTLEQHTERPPVQKSSTDSFRGMCVTFSLLYTLLSVMNADHAPVEVHRHLVQQSDATLKTWVLRLNRRIADTLRSLPRGSLVRSGTQSSEGTVHLPLRNVNLRRHSPLPPRRRHKSPSEGVLRRNSSPPVPYVHSGYVPAGFNAPVYLPLV